MPKLLNSAPRYRCHKSAGQAVVRLEGRDIYRGKHGTTTSREAYKRFVAKWSHSGGKLPAPTSAKRAAGRVKMRIKTAGQ